MLELDTKSRIGVYKRLQKPYLHENKFLLTQWIDMCMFFLCCTSLGTPCSNLYLPSTLYLLAYWMGIWDWNGKLHSTCPSIICLRNTVDLYMWRLTMFQILKLVIWSFPCVFIKHSEYLWENQLEAWEVVDKALF